MSNGNNNWDVGYSSITFTEGVLANHTKVKSFTREDDIRFQITRISGLKPITAVLVNEYHLGEAAAYEIMEEFGKIDAIVNNGKWNHIVVDWREFAERTGVAVLGMAEFLGALNAKKLTDYETPEEREERRKKSRRTSRR